MQGKNSKLQCVPRSLRKSAACQYPMHGTKRACRTSTGQATYNLQLQLQLGPSTYLVVHDSCRLVHHFQPKHAHLHSQISVFKVALHGEGAFQRGSQLSA